MIDWSDTKKTLTKFGNIIIKDAKRNLPSKRRSGPMAKSLKFEMKFSKASFTYNFTGIEYAKFQDKGVKGHGRGNWTPKKPKRRKAQQSPYQFKTGPGKNTILKSLVERPDFRTRDLESGQFTPKTDSNMNSAAFLIARSLGRYGIPRSGFMSKAVQKNGRALVSELGVSYVKDQKPFIDSLKKDFE